MFRKPPCCGNCTQKGLECDFQEYAAVFDNIRVVTPNTFRKGSPNDGSGNIDKPPANHQRPVEIRQPSGLSNFSMEDLGLLHHFTLSTSSTIPAFESELYCHIWRQEVPRLAQSHGFLMHAVLGFAAAHQLAISDVDPALRDYSVVRHHYSQALILFRTAVQVIDQEQAEALLSFSILTSFLTLYLECGTPTGCADAGQGVIVFLQVVQNSTRVLEQVRESIRGSTVGVLLSHTWNKESHAIAPETERSLFVLDCLASAYLSSIDSANSESAVGSILLNGLAKLRQLFALVDPKEKGWSFILLWPIKLDPGFITLLQSKNPIALCALAHWCVPIYHAPRKWWTGDWPKRMLIAVEEQLRGTQWEEGIRWPLEEDFMEDSG